MTTPDISNPSDALAASVATRARVRSLPVGDAGRRASLEAAREAVRHTWTVEHRRYVRRGRQLGRTVSDDPVRVLGRERRAELARLQSMLDPRPGTPRPDAPALAAESMNGHILRTQSVLAGVQREHATLRVVLGGGRLVARRGGRGRYVSMSELNAEARRLLHSVSEARRALTTAHGRFQRQAFTTYAQQDGADKVATRVEAVRQDAAILAADLRRSATRTTPLAESERRAARAERGHYAREAWTPERIERTLRSFRDTTDRWPTAAELRGLPTLPHYTTLVRRYGPRFLSRLDTLVPISTSEGGTP